jgi:hypothetical protein
MDTMIKEKIMRRKALFKKTSLLTNKNTPVSVIISEIENMDTTQSKEGPIEFKRDETLQGGEERAKGGHKRIKQKRGFGRLQTQHFSSQNQLEAPKENPRKSLVLS